MAVIILQIFEWRAKEKALAEGIKEFVEQMPRGINIGDDPITALRTLDEFQE